MRRFAGLLSLLTVACALPEDGNPTPRCTVDAHCPEAMRCYRSYCIADEDAAIDGDAGGTRINIDGDDGRPEASLGPTDAGVRDAGAAAYVDAGGREAASPAQPVPPPQPIAPPAPGKPPPPKQEPKPRPKPGGPGATNAPGRPPPPAH